MLKGFRDFVLRGNVVDLAVAVVMGTAFGAIVNAFATDVIGGLIAQLGGLPDVGDVGWGSVVVGTTVTAVLNFAIVAAVVYFLVVVPTNRLLEMRGRGEEPEVTAPTEDIALLQEIRDLLRARSDQV
jgi:large conductance mechanosensitive channel